MEKFYLRPVDGRKSFYQKAVVLEEGNRLILRSYNTDVAEFDRTTGRIKRLWSGYSATTMRHINAFVRYCGLACVGGKSGGILSRVERRNMYAENDCNFDVIHILFGCHVCVWNVDNVELDQPRSYGGVGRWHILLCANRRWKRLAV